MAEKGTVGRDRLSTDLVLQLLLDEKSDSESENESISEYQQFVGKVLTDSEGEAEDAEENTRLVTDNDDDFGPVAREKTQIHDDTSPTSMETSEVILSITPDAGEKGSGASCSWPLTVVPLESVVPTSSNADQQPLDPFASSDSQASDQEKFTILEQPSGSEEEAVSGIDKSRVEEEVESDSEDSNECLSSESPDVSNDETHSPIPSTSRCSRRGQCSGRRGVIRQTTGRARVRGTGGGTTRSVGSYSSFIPNGAKKIQERDTDFEEPMDFQPSRQPGPQISLDDKSPLDIFRLFFDDDLLKHLVASTIAYAEMKKLHKPTAYQRFMLHKTYHSRDA